MGTLFDQSQRKNNFMTLPYLEEITMVCEDLMKSSNVTMNQAIEIYRIAEYQKRTNHMISDCDAKDEQLAGFGEIANNLVGEIREFTRKDGTFELGLLNAIENLNL
jgi:hypothetical protein